MKFTKQKNTIQVTNVLDDLCTVPKSNWKKHGPLLPDSIRCIICGPSNCGKSNLMFTLLTDEKGLKYANLYIFSTSLEQPKYKLLAQIMANIPQIGFHTFSNSEDVMSPAQAAPNSIMVFDDVACDSQDQMRAYFSMGRHRSIDCFYLCQTYSRIPKQLLRDNSNLIILFKQDELNLKHVYDEHVGTDMTFVRFKEFCAECWNREGRHSFITISKDDELNSGRYRCGLDVFVSDI